MDYEYWNEYYNKKTAPNEASMFACYVMGLLEKGKKLVELGCGNGRDSVFFANNNIDVTALDQSDIAIAGLNNKHNNIEFICDDFVKCEKLSLDTFNYAYSRFTLHSISDKQEVILLENIYNILKDDGLFFIEARSVKDEIFGRGEKVGRNAYVYNEHYRRFIEMEDLVKNLEQFGFEVVYARENDNWAVYRNENPVVVRVIAKKK